LMKICEHVLVFFSYAYIYLSVMSVNNIPRNKLENYYNSRLYSSSLLFISKILVFHFLNIFVFYSILRFILFIANSDELKWLFQQIRWSGYPERKSEMKILGSKIIKIFLRPSIFKCALLISFLFCSFSEKGNPDL
jgi:hypothetical protein